jgi:hypothetical protein
MRMTEIQPLLVGGGMVDSLTKSGAQWAPAPAGLEAHCAPRAFESPI